MTQQSSIHIDQPLLLRLHPATPTRRIRLVHFQDVRGLFERAQQTQQAEPLEGLPITTFNVLRDIPDIPAESFITRQPVIRFHA